MRQDHQGHRRRGSAAQTSLGLNETWRFQQTLSFNSFNVSTSKNWKTVENPRIPRKCVTICCVVLSWGIHWITRSWQSFSKQYSGWIRVKRLDDTRRNERTLRRRPATTQSDEQQQRPGHTGLCNHLHLGNDRKLGHKLQDFHQEKVSQLGIVAYGLVLLGDRNRTYWKVHTEKSATNA